MIRIATALTVAFALAACGVAGPPKKPAPKPDTGLSVSGSVSVGITAH